MLIAATSPSAGSSSTRSGRLKPSDAPVSQSYPRVRLMHRLMGLPSALLQNWAVAIRRAESNCRPAAPASGQQRMQAIEQLIQEIGQPAVRAVHFVGRGKQVERAGQPAVDVLPPAQQVDARFVLAAVAQPGLR